ncbi:acyl-CoA synthetase [Microbacterium soli]|uniref:Acyl-CoA synthetase n=1 Tax=Microbacterium soli TaxID=446075 RepID=A0ABP7N3H6_9MICO
MPAASRTFTARHVQLTRAVLAAAAALMITFSADHSASVGLSVFSGFAVATGLVLALAAFLVLPAGHRWPTLVIAGASLVLGMAGGLPPIRTDGLFFGLVIAWAALTGLVELIAGIRSRGSDGARDAVITGAAGLLLAGVLAVLPWGFAYEYTTPAGEAASLTGIILGVGVFGAYTAIVAVLLGIAGLTPRVDRPARADAATDADIDRLADHGGHA